ncbi:Protein NRT1/ PTR FAMILY 6.3 [Capsicum annuum]|uniref:Protein NRT1/ PTR FAMILY 6.3 n=1 Tax=Capsicum annuum TaxID=4072 RepID=A0A2G3AP47_CAPAN|nr:Protein NRT1/ PTR FAMILY 6.3 [Capsicum annuum]
MSLPETQHDAKALPDAWDYKGRPSIRSSSGGWASGAMILGVEAVERLTTLGIGVNLVTYLTGTMHLGNATAANNVTNFLGSSFMLTLLGGFIADTFLGRYLTIGIFATVQAMGVTILTISIIIPSLQPPKCEQGSPTCIPASGKQLMFFDWFFFFINVGSLGAVTILVYVQDNLGREWGYGICACAIVLALVLFLFGTRKYRFKKLLGSPLTQIASVFVAAWRNRHLELPSDSSLLYEIDDNVFGEGSKKRKQKLPHSKEYRFLDKAAIKKDGVEFNFVNKWTLSTLTDVEEVKLVFRMLPIWATTIMFWTAYAQSTTFSVSQATTMNRHIGKSFEIPPASLTAFFVGSILLTVIFYDRAIVPICRRFANKPHGLTPLQRIFLGLILSILAMMCAALTEVKRLKVAQKNGLTNDPNATIPMSVFWLIPQFLLIGSGEAFTYIGQLDFFLRECPKGMKTMSTGLFLSTIALGFFFSSILVTIVHMVTGTKHPWLADNLNQGKLHDFYWLLAILSVLNLMFFLYMSKTYVYKEKRLAEMGIELEDSGPVCH